MIQQPLMRHVLSRMALQLEGKRRCCFVLRERGTGVPMPKNPVGAFIYACGKICDLQTRYAFVAEAMEVLGGIGYCEESECRGFTGRCR